MNHNQVNISSGQVKSQSVQLDSYALGQALSTQEQALISGGGHFPKLDDDLKEIDWDKLKEKAKEASNAQLSSGGGIWINNHNETMVGITNQFMPAASQLRNNNESILTALDDADLEKLSGGAIDFFLKLEGIKGESASRSTLARESISLNFAKIEYSY